MPKRELGTKAEKLIHTWYAIRSSKLLSIIDGDRAKEQTGGLVPYRLEVLTFFHLEHFQTSTSSRGCIGA